MFDLRNPIFTRQDVGVYNAGLPSDSTCWTVVQCIVIVHSSFLLTFNSIGRSAILISIISTTFVRDFFLKMYKLVYLSLLGLAVAAPAPQRNRGGQQKQTAFQQAMKIPMGISQAQDGGMILDDMVMVKYVPLIARISGL